MMFRKGFRNRMMVCVAPVGQVSFSIEGVCSMHHRPRSDLNIVVFRKYTIWDNIMVGALPIGAQYFKEVRESDHLWPCH